MRHSKRTATCLQKKSDERNLRNVVLTTQDGSFSYGNKKEQLGKCLFFNHNHCFHVFNLNWPLQLLWLAAYSSTRCFYMCFFLDEGLQLTFESWIDLVDLRMKGWVKKTLINSLSLGQASIIDWLLTQGLNLTGRALIHSFKRGVFHIVVFLPCRGKSCAFSIMLWL